MAGLDDLDPLAGDGVAVAGDDQALERAGPGVFESARHRRRRLAGADHDGAAGDRLRQVGRHRARRVGGSQCRVEQSAQNLPQRAMVRRAQRELLSLDASCADWRLPFAMPFHIDRGGKDQCRIYSAPATSPEGRRPE